LAHRKGKTTIMISHRPSTIKRAEWLVQMDKGQLILEGDFQTLKAEPGAHQKFINHM
ncbi:MAG: hypothetical protein HC940_10980, partial [Acaryochloris sp. SU_5_25]|nr:hypothetical protein [Acaryochloris sp. SU_5_25]